jgi:hypothetical protein
MVFGSLSWVVVTIVDGMALSMRTIVKVVLPHHPLLGRNVNHDPQSWAYRVRPRLTTLADVLHPTHIGILDQGSLGSCTGNAGVGCTGRGVFYDTIFDPGSTPRYPLTEAGAVSLYSRATAIDPYAGIYPPEDTGSDGLSIAKVLKEAGEISGYLWAFTLDEAEHQLMDTPLITGLPWFNSMFDPGPGGLLIVNTASGLAGGHELCVDEFRLPVGSTPAMVGGPNSWGTGWGNNGRWLMKTSDWQELLSRDGDVTAFVPLDEPAPTPTPIPGDETAAGDALWAATSRWANAPHWGSNSDAALAVRRFARATGRA